MLETPSISKFFLTFAVIITRNRHEEEVYLCTLGVGSLCNISYSLHFTAIAKGWIGYVPPIEELENPNLKFATEIISDDGKMLGTWSISKENRVFVGYDQLSPNLIHALIATEDERFSEHSGIDARAFIRALVKRGILMQKMREVVVPSRSSWPSSSILLQQTM